MKYSNLEKFISLSDLFFINEFGYSEIYRIFKQLNEKYNEYLNYDFNDNCESLKLDDEINNLLRNKDLLDLDDNLLYISMNKQRKKDIRDSLSNEMINNYSKMIIDYKKLNNKEVQKRKSL